MLIRELQPNEAGRVAGQFTQESESEWGLKNLPEKYHVLLRDALSEYRGETPGYDISAAKEYAGAMLRLIRNNMQPQ